MTEPRDPLIEAIHTAGEVPPPPDRDAAFARAMRPVLMPSRRRLNRSVIALFAAALLAAPAAVFAERATHAPAATLTPITFEKPDPRSSIQHEADDSTVKRENATSGEHSGSASATDDRSGSSGLSGTDDHSGDGTTISGSDGSGSDGSGKGSGSGDLSTPAPTPMPSATPSLASSDGGSSGSPDGGTPGPN